MKKKTTLLTFLILLLVLAGSTLAQTPQYYNENTGTGSNTYPFGQPNQRVHWLIRYGTMIHPTPCPGGNIDTIYFRTSSSATATFTNLCIKMKSLAITTLPTAWYTTELDTAYFRASVTLSCTIGGWMAIPLDHRILFDTSKALVIDVQNCGASPASIYIYQSSGTPATRSYGTPNTGCPINYVGQDGQIDNFGVHVSPLPPPPPPYCICDSAGYAPITGTAGPSGDDVTATVPMGFTFSFMGKSYTQASICTNGFVVLGTSTYAGFTNNLCGQLAGENPMFAPFWDDLNTLSGGNIIYNTLGPAPTRIFVAQWTNVAYFSGSGNVTMQVRLYETSNRIEFIYGPATANASGSGSVGETDSIGGPGHVYSLTPGSTCPGTIFSMAVCNNTVVWTDATFPVGRRYTFNCPTGIEPISQGIPREYKLSQNYPNPFNPATKISFALPKAGNVELKVYDLLGREVAVLVNEFKTPGNYTLDFNASSYASGVYFYTIKSGSFTDTKKMVVLK